MVPWVIGTIIWDVWLRRHGKETISEWLGRNPEVMALIFGVLYWHLNWNQKGPRAGN